MISIIKKLILDLRPKDYLEAIGPLFLVLLFSYVLYAIKANHDTVVIMMMGLMFWPLYQFIGFLVENSLMNFILALKTKKEHDYIMAIGPFLLLIGLMSLFNYSHWVLLVVSAQLLPLLFHPHDSWDQQRGCVNAFIKSFLLLAIFILVLFGLQQILSKPYDLPYADGGFKYLPGMMIIGIAYYLLSAALDILMQPFMRGATIAKQTEQ